MKEITVQLLGNPEIWAGGEKISFPYKKAEGFFYYICVKKKVSREEVICLLWGDEDETTGKKKLRDAVYQVKRLLGKETLLTWGHTGIALNPEARLTTDWDKASDGRVCTDAVFLDHFYIKNCYEFEEWAEEMRRELSGTQAALARQKIKKAAEQNDGAMLQSYGNILLKSDPYNEELYLELMNLYAQNGGYTMAIRLYNDLKKRLMEEFSEEPSQKATELFHRIYSMKETVRAGGAMAGFPFVGRTRELYRLSGFLAEGEAGASCIAVNGENGSGKTALLEQGAMLAAGNGFLVLKAACYKQGEEFYLSPWNDIFQEMYQLLEREEDSAAMQSLGRFLNGTGAGEAGEPRMTYPMVEKMALGLFRGFGKKRRILLIFDDVQWMDSMSCQLLNRLLLLLGREKLLLLCSMSREGEDKAMAALEPLILKDSVEILNLEPFSKEETDELIRKCLPELAFEEEKKAEIYRATDGNAFFLKELLNLIREKGYTLEKSKRTNYVIQARLSGLSREEREVLGAMSVFPEKIGVEELELLLPDRDRLSLLRILEELQERFLIREELIGWNVRYRFVHRAFQEYVYEQQSNGKRQVCHQILAAYYEEEAKKGRATLLPLVIYHYERCHDQIRACRCRIEWLKEYYTLINENFPVLHWEVSDLDESFGVTPRADEMLKLAGEIMELPGSSEEIRRMKLEMHYIRGRYDIAQGNYSQGLFHIEEGIRLSEELSDRRMLLSCYRQQIFYGIQVEDLERVKTYVELGLRQVELGRSQRAGESGRAVENAAWKGYEGEGAGESGRAGENAAGKGYGGEDDGKGGWGAETPAGRGYGRGTGSVMDGWEAPGDSGIRGGDGRWLEEYSTFLRLKGWYCLHTGRYGEAEQMLLWAASAFERLGGEYGASRAACLNYVGDVYRIQGQLKEAVEYYEKAVELVKKQPMINGLGQFYANEGQALYLAGESGRARMCLEQAAGCLKKNGCLWGLERVEACLALLSLDEGDRKEALLHYSAGKRIAEQIRNPHTRELLELAGERLGEMEGETSQNAGACERSVSLEEEGEKEA